MATVHSEEITESSGGDIEIDFISTGSMVQKHLAHYAAYCEEIERNIDVRDKAGDDDNTSAIGVYGNSRYDEDLSVKGISGGQGEYLQGLVGHSEGVIEYSQGASGDSGRDEAGYNSNLANSSYGNSSYNERLGVSEYSGGRIGNYEEVGIENNEGGATANYNLRNPDPYSSYASRNQDPYETNKVPSSTIDY